MSNLYKTVDRIFISAVYSIISILPLMILTKIFSYYGIIYFWKFWLAIFFIFICLFFKFHITKKELERRIQIQINNPTPAKKPKPLFYYFCDIVDSNLGIGVLEVSDLDVTIKYKSIEKIRSLKLQEINDIRLINGVALSPFAPFVVRALVECNFLIYLPENEVIACKSLQATFDKFITYYEIKKNIKGPD